MFVNVERGLFPPNTPKVLANFFFISSFVGSWFALGFHATQISTGPITINHYSIKPQLIDSSKLGGIVDNKSKLVADLPDNRWWWENTFNRFIGSYLSAHIPFQKVSEGYGKSDNSSLNRVCIRVYGDNKSSINDYIDSIKKYCTKDNNSTLSLTTKSA